MEASFEVARTHIALAEVVADQGDPVAAAAHAEAGRAQAARLAAPALASLLDVMDARLRQGNALEPRA